MPQAGDNSDKMLKRFAERIVALTEQMSDIQEEIKTERKAAKDAGFDVKALNKVVKELGMDSDAQQKQLLFDFEVDAYRKAVGLPTEIADEAKQEAA